MRRHWTSSILLALWLAPGLWAQEIGPARGSLVIVGGAMRDETIMKRFITLAGGPGARIVVIPTAGADEDYDDFYLGARRWRGLGAEATVLHTRDRNVANSEAFTEPIRQATGVWFPGGRPQRLSDVYLGTCIERELHALLERGGVIGGSSAGASIQGSYLVRGDSETNRIVMGDHVKGFGLLRNVAIDQHLITRNRHFDLIPVIEKHPELLGIGIDEDTAIVVRGDTFEVIGQSVVAIYDNTGCSRMGAGSTSFDPETPSTSRSGRPSAVLSQPNPSRSCGTSPGQTGTELKPQATFSGPRGPSAPSIARTEPMLPGARVQ